MLFQSNSASYRPRAVSCRVVLAVQQPTRCRLYDVPTHRCIIDDKPREFDANSCNLLANMAEMVLREIEKDAVLQAEQRRQQLQSEQRQLLRAIDCFT